MRALREGLLAVMGIVLASASGAQLGPGTFLSPTAEVRRSTSQGAPFELVVRLNVAEGYHIQAATAKDPYIPTRLEVTAPPGFRVGSPVYPAPTETEVAGERIPVYEGPAEVHVPVSPPKDFRGRAVLKVAIHYQACNAQSCFPPTTATAVASIGAPGVSSTQTPAHSVPAGSRTHQPHGPTASGHGASPPVTAPIVPNSTPRTPSPPNASAAPTPGYSMSKLEEFVPPEQFIAFLKSGKTSASEGGLQGLLNRSLILALPVIFVLGLALNLTPCVYPIIPITISYFGSQAARQGQRPFVLALLYVLGMAVMYSTLGVIAGMTGSLFGSQLQNPWVLAGFALVMFALALSQFDRKDGTPIWEIQLPGSLRARATGRGGLAGAFLMGVLVGVVAAPCIGPAVVALLQWVAAERSPTLGFASFLALSLGLGSPYLVLGTLSGSLQRLPRSGEWMVGVKHIFGMLLIWMGFYYLQPVLNTLHAGAGDVALAVVTALAGVYLLADKAGRGAKAFNTLRRAIGLVGLGLAVWLLKPAPAEAIRWQPYSQEAVDQAMANHQKVLVDFSAAWCAACKELEHKTFSDARVAQAAAGYQAFRADMTDWAGPAAQRLKMRYGIVGLPTVVRLVPAND